MTRRQRWSRRARLLAIFLAAFVAYLAAGVAMRSTSAVGTEHLAAGAVGLLVLAAGERLLLRPEERSLELERQGRR